MRILYLSQYFPPEIGATQTRAYEMAQGLIRAGHQVTMITEVPNHPEGIIRPEYRGRLYVREELDGIDVRRVWVSASPNKNFRTRMAFYLSFMLNAALAGLGLARGRYDVIYTTSPPLFVGGAALTISYLRRIPLVFEVRDLWPESAVLLGELNNQLAARLSTWLETMCYRRARQIVTVVKSIKNRLIERGYPETQICLIRNGANIELYQPAPINQTLRRELDIGPDQFVLIYTGLHGLMHGLDTAVEAAHLLRDQADDLLFIFVGDGVRKAALQARVQELALKNVRFYPLQPEKKLPGFITMANAGLSLGRKNPLSRGALPVKMFTYMACARPVLLAYQGEAAELVNEAQAGIVVEPENPEALAGAIIQLKNDPDTCRQLGSNGRRAVVEKYSRQAQAQQLVQLLERIVDRPKT
jgi:glycosyltransferase involved in cell wall biosynthesis